MSTEEKCPKCGGVRSIAAAVAGVGLFCSRTDNVFCTRTQLATAKAEIAQLTVEKAALNAQIVEDVRKSEAAIARADAAERRLAKAWAFNAGGTWTNHSDVQIRRSGPAGTYWFITRGASTGFDGAAFQRDGSWGGAKPRPFDTADEAFAAYEEQRTTDE